MEAARCCPGIRARPGARRAVLAAGLLLAALLASPAARAGPFPPATGVASLLIFDASFNVLYSSTDGVPVNGPGALRIDSLGPFPGTMIVSFDPDPMVSYELFIENVSGGRIEGALVLEVPIVQTSGGPPAYSRLDAQAVDPGAGVGLEAQHLPILVDLDASGPNQDTFFSALVLDTDTTSSTPIRLTDGPEPVPNAPRNGKYERLAVQLSFALEPGDRGVFGGSTSFPSPVGGCDDFIDNDGDGLVDHAGGDPGCDSSWDSTERALGLPCDDGFDGDGDGWTDAPFDPGCRNAASATESPQCQDGVDNEGDGYIDFDGGVSAGVPGPQQTAPDPQCKVNGTLVGWRDQEHVTGKGPVFCGIGPELTPLLGLLGLARGRRRARPR